MRAGRVWLMKTFWQIEEQRRRCLRAADLLKRFYCTLSTRVHGFNYMLNEDDWLLLAKQHVLSVLFIIRVLGKFLSA